MTTPNGLFQLLARCPRCDARNVVDIRKQGLARRARCGRCGEPLPRRLPAPLLFLTVAGLVVVLGIAHFAVAALRERQGESRRAEIQRLLETGRATEAVELLPSPRPPSSDDALLARQVAQALAAPVLEAARDAGSGPAAVESAVELGDRLVEKHQEDLPELLAVLDDPLRRLQARRVAFDILEVARAHASEPVPDLAKVERALQDATVLALDSPADVAAAVEDLTPGIRARAALSRARGVVQKRPDEARQLLQRTAQRLLAPTTWSQVRATSPVKETESLPLTEQIAVLRRAVDARDAAALEPLVHVRADGSWPKEAREELDREVVRACHALASLAAERAAREWDPEARARELLRAMTCDEVLPRDFLADAHAALAETLVEAARRGGSLEDALLAWDGVESPRRDRDLAALGCLAESRQAHAVAVLAWSRVGSAEALGLLARCTEEPSEPLPPPTMPVLAYPGQAP